jgi:hypothetical protein
MQLSETEIKIRLLRKGVKPADLARSWNVPKENLSRVINRTPGFVFPEIKGLLANFLGVPVSAVGRVGLRSKKEQANAA